ncbi:MAG TPA: ABC transporter permease, partial [Nitrososphaerales archaeon]|nr:ABC transporter permease [Nitrososphaerales archaeon]
MVSAGDVLRNKWVVRGAVLGVILVVWQVLGQSVNPIIFAPPGKVATTFASLWNDGTLPSETEVTVVTLFLGFLLSCAIGIPLGLVMGRIRLAEYAIDPYVNFIYATPLVAIIPLALIWFGPSNTATYFIITLHTAPPILINTMSGVKATERGMVETGRSFGFKGWKLWRKVVLPSSLPYIMAGLRIGIGAALIGTMVAEIFLFNAGLGYELVNETALFNSAAVVAGVLIIMVIGIIL